MNTKSRNLLILVAVVILSVMVWGAVAAQDATSTAEPQPNAASTVEPAPMATTEAGTSSTTAHPFLGVSLQDGTNGVSVAEVVDGSGAATAGIKVGDVITAINGTKVTTAQEAAAAVSALKVGDSVTIDLTRNGNKMTVTATLGTAPAQMQPGQPMNPPQPGQGQPGNGNGNGTATGMGTAMGSSLILPR